MSKFIISYLCCLFISGPCRPLVILSIQQPPLGQDLPVRVAEVVAMLCISIADVSAYRVS